MPPLLFVMVIAPLLSSSVCKTGMLSVNGLMGAPAVRLPVTLIGPPVFVKVRLVPEVRFAVTVIAPELFAKDNVVPAMTVPFTVIAPEVLANERVV